MAACSDLPDCKLLVVVHPSAIPQRWDRECYVIRGLFEETRIARLLTGSACE